MRFTQTCYAAQQLMLHRNNQVLISAIYNKERSQLWQLICLQYQQD